MDEGVAEYEVEERQEVMMASLGNKNKKKGYKQFLMAPVPKKIVYTEDGQPVVSSLASVSALVSPPITQPSMSHPTILVTALSASSEAQKPRPRLIPPSEIQERGELPPNMFVTSVDVEAGLGSSNRKKKKRKSRGNEADFSYDHTEPYIDESGYQAEEDITLAYGDETKEEVASDNTHPAPETRSANSIFDWSQAEKLFENATKISQVNDLRIGQIVGWRNLELNPQTFRPEILLIAAKVIDYSDGVSAKTQRLVRPIDPDSGCSGFLAPVDHDEDPGEVEGEVEEHQWGDILISDWRVLQLP